MNQNSFVIGYMNPKYKDNEIFIGVFDKNNINKEVFSFFLFNNFVDYYNCNDKKSIHKIYESINYLESKGWIIMNPDQIINTIDNLFIYYPYLQKINTLNIKILCRITFMKILYIKNLLQHICHHDLSNIILKYLGNIIHLF